MGLNPFARRPTSQTSGANRRRSTRVEFATAIILTGRDAAGQPFREETATTTVSLHGARLRTIREILVGMVVGVENPCGGKAEKAVCVRVDKSAPGENAHHIAVQLVHAGNIWGLENPPADWKTAAEAPLLGRTDSTAHATAASGMPPPVTPPAGDAFSESAGAPSLDSRFAELEQRSAQLLESVIQILRRQAEEIMASVLQEMEARLKAQEAVAEARINGRAEKALADIESSIEAMRRDVAEQLAARTARVVDSAEEDLRARISDLLAPLLGASAGVFPAKRSDPAAKK